MNITTIDFLDIFTKAALEVSEDGELPRLTLGTPLTELGFDSVQLAELVSCLGERLGARATPDRFFTAETIGDVVAVLGSQVPA